MNKEEYAKKLQKCYDDNKLKKVDSYGNYMEGYTDGLVDSLVYAIDLAEKLDEPEKVVIPQFVADWIQEAAQPSNLATISVMHSDAIKYGKHIDWFRNHDNQRLLLKALLYGYEVEKEPELHVKLKGFEGTINYLNYDVNSKDFFVDTTGLGSGIKIKFTKSWLKDNFPEYDDYNNAGLLEFEEVEDD